jgi:glutathione synthase
MARRKPQKHLFVMDPLSKLDFQMDTSLRLAFALHKRGHLAYFAEPAQLYWDSSQASAGCTTKRLLFKDDVNSVTLDEPSRRKLTDFNGIHMRKDPPYDMDYITTTWLLETAIKKVNIYNSPESLRTINEKLGIINYPDCIRPAIASFDPISMLNFIKTKAKGDAIIKPLTLYSGKGIRRINLHDGSVAENDALEILRQETRNCKEIRLIQPFDKNIMKGEVRAFTVGGKALAWCLKKPTDGQFMANSSFGSTRHKYRPSKIEQKRVSHIARDLWKKGVAFIGFDLIGGYISEINITSPRLLTAPDDDYDYYSDFSFWVEKDSSI